METVTLRSIATPASTAAAGGIGVHSVLRPKDVFPTGGQAMNQLLASDAGSFQMVASEIGANRGSRARLLELEDAAMGKALSEHVA